jgi:hypothetical protein
VLYAVQGLTYDITKAQLPTYPGAVRADYVNGVDGSRGYGYTGRWFDWDDPLTIHVRPLYDDVTGVGSPNGSGWLDAVVNHYETVTATPSGPRTHGASGLTGASRLG